MPYTSSALQTARNDLAQMRLHHTDLPAPAPGQIVCRIDLLSLSSNNITYAAFGDSMDYWRFFPTGDPAWGQMPAWGYATVVASAVPELPVGERLFGYWPLASHVLLEPEGITALRFVEGSAHRRTLVSAYNRYTRVAADPDWQPAQEGLHALLLPLFLTAWMLADQLQDQQYHGARRILFSSASSKTAWLTAWCLREAFGNEAAAVQLAGLTSARNRDFVTGLGLFDQVCGYDQLAQLPPAADGTVYVDFSGDPALRRAVHRHLGDTLRQSLFAGSAQHAEAPARQDAQELPGPAPVPYFAPVQVRKRNADWGAAEVARRFTQSQRALYAHLSGPGAGWIELSVHQGMAAAEPLLRRLLTGTLRPQEGLLLRPGPV